MTGIPSLASLSHDGGATPSRAIDLADVPLLAAFAGHGFVSAAETGGGLPTEAVPLVLR
jgi:hypothetical protein